MSDDFDPTDIEASAAARSDKDRRDRAARLMEEDDVKWLMGSKRGRRIAWRFLEQAGVFRSTFNTNALAMAFAEGGRNAGLRMLSLIHSLCPELYHPMVKEQADDGHNAGRAHNH